MSGKETGISWWRGLLCPWAEDKFPLAYPGVWTLEPPYAILVFRIVYPADLDTLAAVREQVKVDHARSISESLGPPDEPLRPLEHSEDLQRSKRALKLGVSNPLPGFK